MKRRADRFDELLLTAYRRLGPRYMPGALVALFLTNAGPLFAAAIIASHHREFGVGRTLFTLGVAQVGLLLAWLIAYWGLHGDIEAVVRWTRGTRSDAGARAILLVPRRIVAGRRVVVMSAMSIVAAVPLFGFDEDGSFDLVAGLLWAEGTAFALLWGFVSIYFAAELALRPLRRELDPLARGEFDRVRWFGVTPKLLLGLATLVAGLAFVLTALLAEPGSDPGALMLQSLLVALFAGGLGLMLVLPIARNVVSPVEELIDGTSAVAEGDLDVAIPVTSTDELGELAVSFNEMVAGLREREALRLHNDELLEEVRASRVRIVAASDAERRRVERNIHDGAQQQLVGLALKLRALEEHVAGDGKALVAEAEERLKSALHELRELARGLHPSVLTTDGLAPALEQLAARAPLPVTVTTNGERYPEAIESTAYFVVSEALANVGKYAQATHAAVAVERRDGRLVVKVSDDGLGGADIGSGSGLTGLRDRLAALDGTLTVDSPPGEGTRIVAELPLRFSAGTQSTDAEPA